jgi:hypothetical protein
MTTVDDAELQRLHAADLHRTFTQTAVFLKAGQAFGFLAIFVASDELL